MLCSTTVHVPTKISIPTSRAGIQGYTVILLLAIMFCNARVTLCSIEWAVLNKMTDLLTFEALQTYIWSRCLKLSVFPKFRPPRLEFLPLEDAKLPLSESNASFRQVLLSSSFSSRFLYSSINKPLTLSQFNSSILEAFRLLMKLSYYSGRLPRITVANLCGVISSFNSRNCSANEVMYVKCSMRSVPSFIVAA